MKILQFYSNSCFFSHLSLMTHFLIYVFAFFIFQDLRKQVAPLLKSFQGEVSAFFSFLSRPVRFLKDSLGLGMAISHSFYCY